MSETLENGAEIAGYRVSGMLGRGGMGWVYEAEHTILRRKAALKTLAPEFAGDGEFRERFVNESQLVAALDHPSIISIYDAGEVDGVVYIAMRYVSGGDLKGAIEQGPLDVERSISMLEQVAGALDAAHAHGLVHRDVKPANVLLDSDGRRVYLTDFGIAKQARSQGLTRPGFFVGTLDYAAPEQIKGESVGEPADIYAFGCLLFECLTGQKPFERETDVAVMYAHLLDPRPTVTALVPGLPAELDGVMARALALDEHERFGTCGELIEAVRVCIGGKGVTLPQQLPAARAATRLRASLTGFPVESAPLIGRERELAGLTELVGRPDVRLVTLTGPGGMGKTRLATAAAAELSGEFGRVFFVDLAPVREAGVVGSVIGKVLGVEETGDASFVAGLARRLGGESALLVLDTFEHVLPAATLLHEMIAGVPELTVLVTSQASMHLREEHEFPVGPLLLPDPADLGAAGSLAGSPAVALFLDRARAVKPDFELTDENAEAVVGICVRLDGLPLAIELAAARVRLLSPRAILARLETRLDLLTGGASDLPTRQRTLRAAIEWSYNLLEPFEQTLLNRLGVFVGGCSLEVADAVCGHEMPLGKAFEGLASLIDKSLVRQWDGADGEPRFGLFETIREYARERLEEAGELEQLRRRHAERYVGLVETAEPELTKANQAIWLQRLDEEIDNIRAALAWTVRAGEAEFGLRLASALVRFWSTRGLMGEGRRWVVELLAVSDGVAPSVLAKAHFAAGYTGLEERDFGEAIASFETSLAIAQEIGDPVAEAKALAQLGWLLMASGELDRAREAAEKSLSLASEAGDKLTASTALGAMAEIALVDGDYDEAVALFERGLMLRRALGDKRLIANSLLSLGRAELGQGQFGPAVPLLEEGLSLARQVKDTWSISVALDKLGRMCVFSGDPARARELLGEGLRIARDRNDTRTAAECVQGLGAVQAAEGHPRQAVRLFAAADTLLHATAGVLTAGEVETQEQFLATLRASLGEETFQAEWEAGRSLSSEDTFSAALAKRPRASAETISGPAIAVPEP